MGGAGTLGLPGEGIFYTDTRDRLAGVQIFRQDAGCSTACRRRNDRGVSKAYARLIVDSEGAQVSEVVVSVHQTE